MTITKTNKEIRVAARACFRTSAGARAMNAMLLLMLTGSVAMFLLQLAFQVFGIQPLEYFLLMTKGNILSVPRNVLLFATLATLFAAFVRSVFVGIQCYGWSTASLHAINQTPMGFIRESFAGFKASLEMFSIVFAYALYLFVALLPFVFIFAGIVVVSVVFRETLKAHIFASLALMVFSCLTVLFSFVPALYITYRYRFVWYLKVMNPEWRAVQCFCESGRMMDGLKFKAFFLDCSYWKPIALLIFFSVLGALPIVPPTFRVICLSLIVPVLGFFVSVYIAFGHALFFLVHRVVQQVKDELEKKATPQ